MNIVRAMTEKIEASGDVIHLRTCYAALDGELKEMKRRAARQDEEMKELRRTVTLLQRENNILREGGGSFLPRAEEAPSRRQGPAWR